MKPLSIVVGISFFVLVLGSCDKSAEEECKERGSNWYWTGFLDEKCIDLTDKLQKTPQFIPGCVDTEGNFDTSPFTIKCDEEFQFQVACGTRPGQVDPEVYCIDSYDIVAFGKEASCRDSKHKVQCRLRK